MLWASSHCFSSGDIDSFSDSSVTSHWCSMVYNCGALSIAGWCCSCGGSILGGVVWWGCRGAGVYCSSR